MPVTEGSLLDGKLRLLRKIAAGGMGSVWEAEHVEIHRRVAVKVLRAEYANEEDVIARFRREARIAGSLGHDNICDVLDVGRLPQGGLYLVMPLLRGSSLADLLAREGKLAPARALDIVAQMLAALAAAHAAGIVHRDLKPSNVFVTTVGDRPDFVKVLDFGVSKMTTDSFGSTLTSAGSIIGTPRYMSPEQARGDRDVDARTDVYATGAILYELLCGVKVYPRSGIPDLMEDVALGRFRPLPDVAPDVAPEIAAIVARALAFEREERFSDASAMRAAVLAQLPAGRTSTPDAVAPPVAAGPWIDDPGRPSQPPTIALRPQAHADDTIRTPEATPLSVDLRTVVPTRSSATRRWLVALAGLVGAAAIVGIGLVASSPPSSSGLPTLPRGASAMPMPATVSPGPPAPTPSDPWQRPSSEVPAPPALRPAPLMPVPAAPAFPGSAPAEVERAQDATSPHSSARGPDAGVRSPAGRRRLPSEIEDPFLTR